MSEGSTASDSVSLREHLSEVLRAYVVSHGEVHEVERATRKQTADDLSGRLDRIAAQIAHLDKQAQVFVTRDMLDQQVRTTLSENRRIEELLRDSMERIEKTLAARLAPLEDFQKGLTGKLTVFGVAVTVINLLITYFGK